MKTINILPKIYSFPKQIIYSELKNYINREFIDLDLNVKIDFISKAQIKISLEGPDEEIAHNFLKKSFVTISSLNSIKTGLVKRGRCISVGKHGFGLFVNIGLIEPKKKDALLPLFELRTQLLDDQDFSLRSIIDLFGFIDGFPLEVEISEINEKDQVFVRLTNNQIDIFKSWIEKSLDRLFVYGINSKNLYKIISQINQFGDIHSVDRLGLFDFILILKEDTSAKGMLPILGKKIQAKMNFFSPKMILKRLEKIS
ncbi:MAG: DUF2110 family protein [Candidatus Helarchaeota archaeon]